MQTSFHLLCTTQGHEDIDSFTSLRLRERASKGGKCFYDISRGGLLLIRRMWSLW